MQLNMFTKEVSKKQKQLGVFPYQFASEAVDSFRKDCRLIGLTKGQFSLIHLITAILKKTGEANVICTTWSAGIKDSKELKGLIDNKNILSFSLITDHSYVTRQKQYAISLDQLFGKENIRTSDIHAKFVLISNDNFKVTIRTSMNLNANKTCENFEIDDDQEIFDFYMKFVQDIFVTMPEGFVSDSRIVSKSVKQLMKTEKKKEIGFIF